MKHKKKSIILTAIIVAVLGLAAFVFINLPKPVSASNTAFDLTQTADGIYTGGCDNGLVKVQAEVTVQNHEIVKVRLLKHTNGLGGAAEAITDTVVQYQSVELDAVSGATMSSKTILKAVENALSERQETV